MQQIIGHILDPIFFLQDHASKVPWPCSGCNVDCNYSNWTNADHTVKQTRLLPNDYLFKNPDFVAISWRITGRCNLNCPHCAADRGRFPREELSVDQVAMGANGFLSKWRSGLIDITGGEPTMHPAWSHLVKMALESDWSIIIHTNFSHPCKIIEAISKVDEQVRSRLKLIISCHMPVQSFHMQTMLDGATTIRSMSHAVQMTIKFLSFNPVSQEHTDAAHKVANKVVCINLRKSFGVDWQEL